MVNEFEVIPLKAVGPIEFGMKKEELEEIMKEKPDRIKENKGESEMRWGNLSVKLNKKGDVYEITFFEGEKRVIYNKIDLLKEKTS